jgi:hypothetical protein
MNTQHQPQRHKHHRQGHPVALVNARDLSNGTPAPLLHSALRQFLGAATPADDVAALVGWWADELKERGSLKSAGGGGGEGASAPRQLRARKGEGAGGRGRRPLAPPVLVVSDGERCDMPALQQLIKELSEVRVLNYL